MVVLLALAGAVVTTAAVAVAVEDDGRASGAAEVVLHRVEIEPRDEPRPRDRPGADADRGELLPDLDQEAPTELLLVAAGDALWLSFDAALSNVGRGPLVVEGVRQRDGQEMRIEQVVTLASGGERRFRSPSRLVFVAGPDHSHWHLEPFVRYELRRASDGALVGRDRKAGFCLGDRFVTDLPVDDELADADPVFTDECGLAEPGLTELRQGISVGWGDDYDATLEGQYVDVTDVPGGTYVLVHRVDAEDRLREVSRLNNAASVLIRLERGGAGPRLAVLAVCPDDDRCPAGSTP